MSRRNRTARWWALLAIVTLAPLGSARSQTAPATPDSKAASVSDNKAETKKTETKSEKKSAPDGKLHAKSDTTSEAKKAEAKKAEAKKPEAKKSEAKTSDDKADKKADAKKNDTKADVKSAKKPDAKASDTKKSESKGETKSGETKTAKKSGAKPSDKSAEKSSDKKFRISDKLKGSIATPSEPARSHTTSTAATRTLAVPLMPTPAAGSPEVQMPTGPLSYAPPAATGGAPLAAAATAATSQEDMDAVRQAIGFVHAGKMNDAYAVERGIADPLARKLVEWVILRSDDTDADFARYSAFIAANPSWPSMVTFRRRAEAALWQERAPSATVRAFFANAKPLSAKGRFALARALLSDGDRAEAQVYVREAWRNDSIPHDLEAQALELFGDLITHADDKARMDRRLYVTDDGDAGLRAAKRLGGDQPAIAKARIAVTAKAGNAKALLDDVPPEARRDAGYIFSAAQWLRRRDKIAEAGTLMLSAPRDPTQDADEWWVERRLVARKLLDIGDARTAYAIARDAVTPTKSN